MIKTQAMNSDRIVEHPYPEIHEFVKDYTVQACKYDDMVIPIINELYGKIVENLRKIPIKTTTTSIKITNHVTGEVSFNVKNLIVPVNWGDIAVKVFASKYLLKGKELSIVDTIIRVVSWIVINGIRSGYLGCTHLGLNIENIVLWDTFAYDLFIMIINQRGTFNSPVWFNVGAHSPWGVEQTSGCYVTEVDDNMGSIMGNAVVNQIIALGGSGSGCDLSNIRSKTADIGGDLTTKPTGPIGFLRMFDAVLQATRSGGRHRRSAGLTSLKEWHPDIVEYIKLKAIEETKGHWLKDMPGFDLRFASENQMSVFGSLAVQNINTAVRLTGRFWEYYFGINDTHEYDLLDRHGEPTGKKIDARYLLKLIATSELICGDPGIQYHDNINAWNPFIEAGLEFQSSNACQARWATVLTPSGISTIGRVNVGDVIWSGKRWTKITRKVCTGVKRVKKYITRAGIFAGTSDHKIIQYGVRVEAGDADEIDICVGPSPDGNILFDTQSVVDGLVFGDGSVKDRDKKFSYKLLYIGEKDQCYFDDLVAIYITQTPFDGTAYRVRTTLDINELPKTYERRIPSRFLFGNDVIRRSFLRGLFSANGSMAGPRPSLKASSFNVIRQVQMMLSSLGIRSYYTISKARKNKFPNGTYKIKESYDLNITADRKKFRDLIGFIHPYKMERLNYYCNTLGKDPRGKKSKSSYEIVEVRKCRKQPVYEITVDAPEHTYWTGGLLVSNCSEIQWLNNSSCNLASLRITAYKDESCSFGIDFDALKHDIFTLLIAQDILIDHSYYPTQKIAKTAHETRNLGLNFGDIGELLFEMGLPYDSDEGRFVASLLSAYVTGVAYQTSGIMAKHVGPYPMCVDDKAVRSGLTRVLKQHASCVTHNREILLDTPTRQMKLPIWLTSQIAKRLKGGEEALELVRNVWEQVIEHNDNGAGEFRNSAVSVFVPMGTVGLVLGCGTTGIEPKLSHRHEKQLVGGGKFEFKSDVIFTKAGLETYRRLFDNTCSGNCAGCSNIDGCRLLETSLGTEVTVVSPNGISSKQRLNVLIPNAHVDMMAAVQPFISMGMSKCVIGSTVITTTDGLKRIGTFYAGEEPDTFTEFSLGIPTGRHIVQSDYYYYGGLRKVWTVTLEDGRSITGTSNHKLLVATNDGFKWRKLTRLREDDYIVLYYGAECWGNGRVPKASINQYNNNGQQNIITIPDKPSFDLGLFFGMFTADGHIARSTYSIGLTKNEPYVLDEFQRLLKKLFNLDSRRVVDSRNGVTGVTKGSKSLMQWLDDIGFTKRNIPDFILGGTREMALGYLSGIYLDGWVVARHDKKKGKRINEIGLSQQYRSIILDVQALWDNLGVRTYINKNMVNGKNYPTLRVRTFSIPLVAGILVWMEEHKRDNALELLKRNYVDTRRWPFIDEVNRIARKFSSKYHRFRYTDIVPYRSTIMNMFKDSGYSSTKKRRVYDYLRVVGIEHDGIQEVHDISVPGQQRFIGNGIINHNTCNCPSDITVDEIVDIYVRAWESGLKAVTVYVDGSKVLQPLTVGSGDHKRQKLIIQDPCEVYERRWCVTIGGQKIYIFFGWHPDYLEDVWEIWIRMSGIGGTLDGATSSTSILASQDLQRSLRDGTYNEQRSRLVHTFLKMEYPPYGLVIWEGTTVPAAFADIHTAKSVVNLIGQMLASMRRYPGSGNRSAKLPFAELDAEFSKVPVSVQPQWTHVVDRTCPTCPECGRKMIKSGSSSTCFKCVRCGDEIGGCG